MIFDILSKRNYNMEMLSSLYNNTKYDALKNEVADGRSSSRTLGEQALVHIENRGFSAFDDDDEFDAIFHAHDETHCILEAVLQKIELETDRQPIKFPFPSNGNWLSEHIVLFFQDILLNALSCAGEDFDEYEAEECSLDAFIKRIREIEEGALDRHNYNAAASWLIAHICDKKGEFTFPEGPVSMFDVFINKDAVQGFYDFDEEKLPNEGEVNKWGEVFNFHAPIDYDDLDLVYSMMIEPVVDLCDHIRAVATNHPEIIESSWPDQVRFVEKIVQSVSYDEVCSMVPSASETWTDIAESYEFQHSIA